MNSERITGTSQRAHLEKKQSEYPICGHATIGLAGSHPTSTEPYFKDIKKLFLLFLVSFFVSNIIANPQIDSLLLLSKNATEKQKCELFLEISQRIINDSAKSNSYIRLASHLAKRNNLLPEQAKAFYYLGQNSYNSFDFVGALDWYLKAQILYKSLNDRINITNCYKSIGQCHYSLYQNEKAISQFIEGLKYCENDIENTAKLRYNIALTHLRMRNLDAATSNYREALALNISINNLSGVAANYNGLGMAFKSDNRLDSALFYYYKAHKIFRKLKRKDNMAILLTNIAGIYLNLPDSIDEKKSIQYYNEAWEIFKELGMNQYEAEIRQGIGYAFYKQGQFQKAIDNYRMSIEVNDKYSQGHQITTTNYDLLSRAYEKMNDYKTALKYNKLYAQYSDSLHQKEKYEKIITLEKQYETEKNENEIMRLQAEQKVINVELTKNKQLKLLGFISASLLLALATFVLIKYYDKIKSNRLLEEKNQQIEKSEQELRILNASKNKFFSIIAHDLKNPLHNVMGYSYLLSADYDQFSDAERRKFATDINQSTNNIFRLLQNLLEWARSQTGRLNFTPVDIEFDRILDNSLSVLSKLAEQKNIQINTNSDSKLRVFVDPLMIETVIRNLISNAIKFTPEGGTIEIAARKENGQVLVSVTDSGVGIPEEDVQNLFKIDSKVKRKGTNNEDGSGLGLILCKEFVDKNNGSIWVESNPEKGSSFVFSVPSKAIA